MGMSIPGLDPLHRAAQYLDAVLTHFLPGSCLLCSAEAGKALLCPDCQADLPTLPASCCTHCSLPLSNGTTCGHCQHSPPAFDRVHALFAYDFPVDRLIQALKYGHQLSLARFFGNALGELLAHNNAEFDRILPLPLHPERLAERGFNQSGEIARPIARHLACHLDIDSLLRTRHTPPQARLPLKQRHGNVLNAFACQSDLSGQRILLIDDVMTTGASLNECSRILRIHGASVIEVAVVARALRH